MIFKNYTHQDIWIEHNCERCARFNAGSCNILAKVITKPIDKQRKPVEWERNTQKNALMQNSIKCSEKVDRLPIPKLPKRFDDVPMFDVTAPVDMDPEHA
jgi:hypothetical protein